MPLTCRPTRLKPVRTFLIEHSNVRIQVHADLLVVLRAREMLSYLLASTHCAKDVKTKAVFLPKVATFPSSQSGEILNTLTHFPHMSLTVFWGRRMFAPVSKQWDIM